MKEKNILIIGGGISGLSLAYYLSQGLKGNPARAKITVLDARSRLGGVIETERRDGCILEGGPDAFISEKPGGVGLCKKLGLARELIGTHEGNRGSFILRDGKLIPVPAGFYLLAPGKLSTLAQTQLLSWPGKLRAACDVVIPKKKNADEDESLASFIRRRLGTEVLERVAQPMISGIYSADPEKLSLKATFPQFLKMEETYGSIIRGLGQMSKKKQGAMKEASGPRYSLFLTLRNGLESLVQKLREETPDVEYRLSTEVSIIERLSENRWKVSCQPKNQKPVSFEADVVCMALGAPRAGLLLDQAAPSVGVLLKKIPFESVATVTLAFKRQDVPADLSGFGYVVPAVENRSIIACSFSSHKFPSRSPEDLVLFRAFVGGALNREILNADDSMLEIRVLEELVSVLKLSGVPVFSHIRRYPETMPQYHVGHTRLVELIFENLKDYPGLFLTGNSYRGIGIPDCIRQSEEVAEKIICSL